MLLVDLSYYIFHRYYVVKSWYVRTQPPTDLDEKKILQNKVFMSKFDKTFVQCIYGMARRHRVPRENIVLVQDEYHDRVWRVDHYPKYKASRSPKSMDPVMFDHCCYELIPSMNVRLFAYPCAEADDIIACVVRSPALKNCHKVVITNDNDYLQLLDQAEEAGEDEPSVELYDVRGMDLACRLKNLTAKEYLMFKILRGDTSDNIPRIIGVKAAERWAKEDLQSCMTFIKEKSFSEKYEMNDLLINFARIPSELRDGIMDAFLVSCDTCT
jgi:5'-3' exonuclease